MSEGIKRYITKDNTSESCVNALKLAVEIAGQEDAQRDVILFVPAKNSINETTFGGLLNKEIIRQLTDGKIINLDSGVRIKLESKQTFGQLWSSEVVVGVYVDKKMLEQIDNTKNPSALIVIPWVLKEVEEWKEAWSPEVI